MWTSGRFFRCSDLIVSRPGVVRFFIDEITCRISEGKTGKTTYLSSITPHEGWRTWLLIRLRDFLNCLSGNCNCSDSACECNHLSIAVREIWIGFANTLRNLCATSAITAALLSLRSSFITCLHCFASSDVSWRLSSMCAIPRCRIGSIDFQTLSFHGTKLEILNKAMVFFVDVMENGIFPPAD
uniref:Secreted protein n=1 Tax=Angiostrongylus cantonensis TaxID=6313 RepID=A0A0K0DAX5_ANGCA